MSQLENLREQIQHDIITALDGYNDEIISRVCQVVVDRINSVKDSTESRFFAFLDGTFHGGYSSLEKAKKENYCCDVFRVYEGKLVFEDKTEPNPNNPVD